MTSSPDQKNIDYKALYLREVAKSKHLQSKLDNYDYTIAYGADITRDEFDEMISRPSTDDEWLGARNFLTGAFPACDSCMYNGRLELMEDFKDLTQN